MTFWKGRILYHPPHCVKCLLSVSSIENYCHISLRIFFYCHSLLLFLGNMHIHSFVHGVPWFCTAINGGRFLISHRADPFSHFKIRTILLWLWDICQEAGRWKKWWWEAEWTWFLLWVWNSCHDWKAKWALYSLPQICILEAPCWRYSYPKVSVHPLCLEKVIWPI